MKILFICSTELQLFNALNLKMHLFYKDSVDIVIQFLKEDTVSFSQRVQATCLFENVCYRLPDMFGIHAYARCVRKGDFSKSLQEAVENSAKQLYVKFSSAQKHTFIDNVKKQIHNFDKLDFESYQKVFAGGTNEIVVNILKYVRYNNPSCQINLYEEGVGSYVLENLGGGSDIRLDNVYLYEPTLALYTHPSFLRIPKISRNDNEFMDVINCVFDYFPKDREIKNKIIFFDNYADPMPAYLQRSDILAHTIFRNAYLKHLRDHQIYIRQLEIYNLLVEKAKGREILLKLHPRTERNNIEKDYAGPRTRIMENLSVPWEVFCCNCEIRDNIFVTLTSSAASSNSFVLEGNDNNKIIIMVGYKDVERNPKYKEFFQKFRDYNRDSEIYLPTDEKQYVSALNKCL